MPDYVFPINMSTRKYERLGRLAVDCQLTKGEMVNRLLDLALAADDPGFLLAHRLRASTGFDDDVCAAAVELVAELFALSPATLTSSRRERQVADARAVAQAAARSCGATLPAIGKYFDRHHTTVMHSVDKVAASAELRAAADEVRTAILQTRGELLS